MFIAWFFIWLGALLNTVAAVVSVYGNLEDNFAIRLQQQTGWILIATGTGIMAFSYS